MKKNPDMVPNFGNLFLRNLLLVVLPIEVIAFLINKDSKRLRDKAANTIVVNTDKKVAVWKRITSLVLIAVLFFSILFSYAINTIKSSKAYETAIEHIEQDPKTLKQIGGVKEYGYLPSGSVNVVNGQGEAFFTIEVIGNKETVHVSVYLEKKRSGRWRVVEMY